MYNCNNIISYDISWEKAKVLFDINNGDLERIYIRYIIEIYGIKKAKILLKDE